MSTPASATPDSAATDETQALDRREDVDLAAPPRRDVQAVPGMRAPRTFAALRHRNFRLFWLGNLVSLVGTWMQIVAQSWLVYQLTGSSLLLGVVSFASSMPAFVLSIPGGVWVDRYNKRTILYLTQAMSMLLAFVLAALVVANLIQVWQVVVLAVLLGMVNAIDAPARQAITIDLASREDLMNAIALNSTAFNVARVVGPAMAGILVGLTGVAMAFFLNGLSFAAVLVALAMMRLPAHTPSQHHDSVWKTAAVGLNYVRTNTTILALISLLAVSSLFVLSYGTLMPVFAGDVLGLGATGYGLLMSATGVGAVVAALTLASLGNFRAKGKLLTVSNIVFPLALIALAASRWLPLSLAALVVAGWSMVSQGALTNTLIQSTVPDHLRGRVLSIYMLVFFGFMPIGSLFMGWLAERIGAPLAITLGALLSLIYAVFIFFRAPAVRAL